MRIHWGRAIGVTVLLVALGGVVGSVLGTLVLLLLSLRRFPDWTLQSVVLTWVMGTMIGTPLGAIGGPTLGWLLLRRVPLGRAIVATALGTVIGSLVGAATWRIARIGGDVGGLFLIAGAVAGFVVTAVGLWAITATAAAKAAG